MAILFPVKSEMAILFFVKRDPGPPFTTLVVWEPNVRTFAVCKFVSFRNLIRFFQPLMFIFVTIKDLKSICNVMSFPADV